MLRFSGVSALTTLLSNSTWPWDGLSNPEMMLSKVDLPQPDGPSKAKAPPCSQMWSISRIA
ncbi:hypothetical protein D3C84_1101270 [compost metagenome]